MNVQDTAAFALEQLTNTGAQQVSVQATSVQKREFNVDGGQFSLLRTTFDNALDLTLIKDHCRGKVAGNDFSKDAVQAAVQDALTSAQSAQPDEAWQLYPGEQQDFNLGAPEGDMDKLFERTQELLSDIGREYPKVMIEQMIVSHTRAEAVYLNNLGARYNTLEGLYSYDLMINGHEGDKTSSFNGVGVSTDNLDTPLIDLGTTRQMLSDIEKQIETQAHQGKAEGAVIFTPNCSGEILGELIGNFVADGAILDGTSPWKDKLGTQVADPALTVRSAPLDSHVVCGERYMPDGRLSQDYDIIKQGVLSAFALSSFVANKKNLTPAPNGSMSLVVEGGEQSLNDLIAGIEHGLLVDRFSGGSPASNGDFSGVAKNSFLIQNGKIGPAVSETMISGNLAQMVKKLRGISRERVSDGHNLLPWLAVDGITISGK